MEGGCVWNDVFVGIVEENVTHLELLCAAAFSLVVPSVLTHPEQKIKGDGSHVAACLDIGRLGLQVPTATRRLTTEMETASLCCRG